MREHHDFSHGKRGAVLAPGAGKRRITIHLDSEVIEAFQQRAEQRGMGYQTLINAALREWLQREPLTLEAVRQVIREELHAA